MLISHRRESDHMKKRIYSVLLLFTFLLSNVCCGLTQQTPFAKNPTENITEQQVAMADRNIRYQDDYYEYVNQDILDLISLSDSSAQWTWFGELYAQSNSDMREIVKKLSKSNLSYPKGSSEQKIKDLYECASNMENRNKTGLGPLQPHFDTINDAGNIDEYVDALAKLSAEFGFSSIVGGYTIRQDKMDSTKNSVYLMYADTLIGKEYIDNPQMAIYVDMYYEYIEDMLVEMGMSSQKAAKTRNDIVMILEQICESTLPIEKYMDPVATYNVYNKEDLQKLYYNIDVYKMLKTLKLDSEEYFIVMDVEQAKKVNSLLVESNLEYLKEYSIFTMLKDAAKYSTEAYARLDDDIYNKLNGITESSSDEYLWLDVTMEMLPWDFGKIYVENNFSRESKEDVLHMIEQIITAYEEIINRQTWLSEETKTKAVRKLETMNIKIGYPDKWPESMNKMTVTPISEGGSLLSNLLENMRVGIEDNLKDLGKDIDRSEWGMAPQEVNAYYNSGNNEIVFPAAILQAPFYDKDNTDAQNLGGIGFVIAHEISHAFDSNGAMYDEYGNMNMWWTEEELAEYRRLSQSIADYYSQYTVAGIKVNGELTLSENIADLGALTCITSIIGDNTSELSRAFSQMAYIWACEATVDYQLNQLHSDTHSPNKVRVNATLSSCDAFYDTYNIRESDKMYVSPENRVGIWK